MCAWKKKSTTFITNITSVFANKYKKDYGQQRSDYHQEHYVLFTFLGVLIISSYLGTNIWNKSAFAKTKQLKVKNTLGVAALCTVRNCDN